MTDRSMVDKNTIEQHKADKNAEASQRQLTAEDMSHIEGWGIDADPDNDPTYPLQQRDNAAHETDWDRPVQQPLDYEVLHSIERPGFSAVYGTSVQPSGLSGMVRRVAFQYGEGSFGHWLPLILADRINSFEGILDDLRHGHIPNIFAEKGIAAEWQFNRPAVIKKAVITAAVVTGVVAGVVWWLNREQEEQQ